MNIHNKCLILVADGQRYLLLRNEGDFRKPSLKVEASDEQPRIAATSELGTDQPGRAVAGRGTMRSAMDQTDFHQLEKDRFAATAATRLRERADRGDFEHLIIVAPPRTLAELRRHYADSVASRIIAEVGKDLTKHTVPEITAILQQDDGS